MATRHGSVSGTRVKSPKMFIGYFNDWRTALETYADANALVRPKKGSDKKGIFGWQSWGGMEKKVNYEGAADVSDFFAQRLQNEFSKDNSHKNLHGARLVWDNLNESQLRSFASQCTAKGQNPRHLFHSLFFLGKGVGIRLVGTWNQ